MKKLLEEKNEHNKLLHAHSGHLSIFLPITSSTIMIDDSNDYGKQGHYASIFMKILEVKNIYEIMKRSFQ